MPGKRTYITLPEDEHQLLSRWAMMEGRCRGQQAQFIVLVALYRETQRNEELRAYQDGLIEERRQDIIHGRLG